MAVLCLQASWLVWMLGVFFAGGTTVARLIERDWIRLTNVGLPLVPSLLYWSLLVVTYATPARLGHSEILLIASGYLILGGVNVCSAIRDIKASKS